MPYEYTQHLNATALFSMKLFPESRLKTAKINTFGHYENINADSTMSQQKPSGFFHWVAGRLSGCGRHERDPQPEIRRVAQTAKF
ncbi:hypothetical protein QCM77_40210 [Bradyrhizobium sp. SSUT18]|uniref:hypothetical protein n=1 Tax=Bradyrhizobium sp. SSUT18 TaxID=3040602 RepID=UPI0024494685|nr:hypothetical protein [Bradyrhizobium sp. SSUT18]MDH2406062.1 hypothetical protein [Bradyrhizobium sp. SSUT18]